MRVFVTGASGAIGSRLVPQLIEAGHEVVGSHNSAASAELLRALGAEPVRLDLLDAGAVRKAVLESEPEAIVHQATALADVKFARNMDKVTAKTNELRTRGTDALLAAAREAGVRRFVAQSVAAFGRYAREGGPIKTEDDPLDAAPPASFREGVAALAHLEQAVTDFGGIALRYGVFYGAANDGTVKPVRARQFPIVGDGGGIWSWIHLDDAAAAAVLALEHDGPAIYNVVDDDPAAVRDWLPVLADVLGAKPPRHLPVSACAHARRRVRGRALDRGAGCLEREGEARARLGAAVCELAHRLSGRLLATRRWPTDRRLTRRPGRATRPASAPAASDLAWRPATTFALPRWPGEPRVSRALADSGTRPLEGVRELRDAIEGGERWAVSRVLTSSMPPRRRVHPTRAKARP